MATEELRRDRRPASSVDGAMGNLLAILGAYCIGSWIAAIVVAARWYANVRTSFATFLTLAGWAAVATVAIAVVSVAM